MNFKNIRQITLHTQPLYMAIAGDYSFVSTCVNSIYIIITPLYTLGNIHIIHSIDKLLPKYASYRTSNHPMTHSISTVTLLAYTASFTVLVTTLVAVM